VFVCVCVYVCVCVRACVRVRVRVFTCGRADGWVRVRARARRASCVVRAYVRAYVRT
jgi:hypothetical protein